MMQGESSLEKYENCWDPEVRINEYKQFETQVQVICTIPVLFAYFAQPEHGLEVAIT